MPASTLLTTVAGGPQGLLRNYWKERLLDILENQLLASDLMEQQVIPANSGMVIEFHRINSFPKQMIGVTTSQGYLTNTGMKGQSFTVDSIVYGIELLTNDLRLDKKSIMTAEPNPIPTLIDRFQYNVKDTLDQRAVNIMVNNTGNTQSATAPSVFYFGASVSVNNTWGDGSQTLTEATLDADIPSHRIAAETFNTVYTRLRSRSVKPRTGRGPYDVLLAPEIAGDLRTDGTFQDIALKGQQRGEDKFEQASIGTVFGCRLIEDENVGVGVAGTVDATNDQIYRCPAVGDGYVARISHAMGLGVPGVNYIPPGKRDKADPHGLVGIITWEVWAALGGILNPLAGEIIRVATTRLKNTSQTDDSTWDA